MKKILLADDEEDIVEFLQYNLKREGFEVITAFDGIETLDKMKEEPDLVILDIMMPRLDGFEVCRRIRSMNGFEKIPIIFLTAKSSEIDEIKGLDLGASDYIKKPISPGKLIARVKANLRSSEKKPAEDKAPVKIKTGPLQINKDKYEITIDGRLKFFPRKEFEILYHLASNPGRIFTRETLLKEVWGPGVFVVDRTIDVHIRKIREKLDKYSGMIETVKGVGYRFKNME